MTVPMPEQECRIEREQVEEVFRLGGGELSDAAWRVVREYVSEVDGKPFAKPGERVAADDLDMRDFRYWYEGAPGYVAHEYRNETRDLRTVVCCALFGMPPAIMWDASTGDRWARIADFRSSGETECPGQHEDGGNLVTEAQTTFGVDAPNIGQAVCPLCEARLGEPHGMIYIGDGWVEALYVRETPIVHFEIIDHGCDGEQYFPGCGASLTKFTDVITGMGDSAYEAGADAYNMLDSLSDVDCSALEKALADLSEVDDAISDNPEWHHYVSIRWRVERS
jgi:hypothetical protein